MPIREKEDHNFNNEGRPRSLKQNDHSSFECSSFAGSSKNPINTFSIELIELLEPPSTNEPQDIMTLINDAKAA